MEPSYTRKRIAALFLYAFGAAVLAGAFYLQTHNKIALNYPLEDKEDMTFVVLTKPALKLFVSNGQVYVESIKIVPPKKKTDLTYQEQVFQKTGADVKYFIPATEDKDEFWENFKFNLATWHFNPFIALDYVVSYAKMFIKKETNIYPHEFFLLTLEMLNKKNSEYTIRLEDAKVPPSKAPERKLKGYSPFTADDRPLIVEVLNASGIKGAALEMTVFLRGLNEKKLLSIDVFQYDNYPTDEEFTKIIYFADKEREIKQLSSALGVGNKEIYKENNPAVFTDARIIIGKDYKPLK